MYNFTNSPQNTPMDIKFIARERLSKSALLLAVISVFLSQTIVFSLILSGIALMQAILSVKGGERLKGKSLYAFLIACFSIALTLYLVISAIFTVIIPAIHSPEIRAQLNEYYTTNLGVDFESMINEIIETFGLNN